MQDACGKSHLAEYGVWEATFSRGCVSAARFETWHTKYEGIAVLLQGDVAIFTLVELFEKLNHFEARQGFHIVADLPPKGL